MNPTDSPAAPPDPCASLPTMIGYDLLAEIDRGGMGVVYRAVDHSLGREIAVKILRDDVRAGRRFLDEARITAQLQHPAIPPVHDLGTLPDC